MLKIKVVKVIVAFINICVFPGGQLHAVSGPEFSLNPWVRKPTGYVVSLESGELTGSWNVPGGLQNPHDVAVAEDGNTVYVCELNPFKVWRLTNGGSGQGQADSQGTEGGLFKAFLGLLG